MKIVLRKQITKNKVQFKGDFTKANFQTGDVITIRDPYRDEAAVFNNRSHDVQFEDINFHFLHGMGIVNQLSENIFFSRVHIAPPPESTRIIASFADCLHFSGCYGQIRIENCLFSGTHDDPINVHGTYLCIDKYKGDKMIVRFMHPQTWGFNPFDQGDSVEIVDHNTLLPIGNSVVKSSQLLSKNEIELTLDHRLSNKINPADCIGNISKTPKVIICNNRFEHILTRGILITTRRKVLIEANTFFNVGMHAILIADDCNSWFESGPVRDITISNNKFINCAYNSRPDNYIIAIKPETDQFKKGQYVHAGIHITQNYFQVFDTPILSAKDVNNLVFEDNYIVLKKLSEFPSGNKANILLNTCNKVKLLNNNYVGPFLQKNIQLHNMSKKMLEYQPNKGVTLTLN